MGNSQTYEMEGKVLDELFFVRNKVSISKTRAEELSDDDLVKSGFFGGKTYRCGAGKQVWGEGFTDEVVDFKR